MCIPLHGCSCSTQYIAAESEDEKRIHQGSLVCEESPYSTDTIVCDVVFVRFKGSWFHIDAKMRCRYDGGDKFRYRHNHPFTTPTNVYFEIGTVLKVTNTEIVYEGSTNAIGSKSCFLIEGNNIIPGRFVPNF